MNTAVMAFSNRNPNVSHSRGSVESVHNDDHSKKFNASDYKSVNMKTLRERMGKQPEHAITTEHIHMLRGELEEQRIQTQLMQ